MMFKEKSHSVLVTGLTWSKAEQNRATGWEAYSQDFITINGEEDYGPGQIRTDFWDHTFSLMRLWWIDKRCPRSSLEAHLGIPWISLYWVLITTVIHSPTSLLQRFIKDDRRQMSVNYTQQVWESWVSVNLSWPAFFSPLFVWTMLSNIYSSFLCGQIPRIRLLH